MQSQLKRLKHLLNNILLYYVNIKYLLFLYFILNMIYTKYVSKLVILIHPLHYEKRNDYKN